MFPALKGGACFPGRLYLNLKFPGIRLSKIRMFVKNKQDLNQVSCGENSQENHLSSVSIRKICAKLDLTMLSD